MSIDYDKLREWLDEATPGPWGVSSGVAGVPEGWDEHWLMIRIGHNNFPLRSLEPVEEEDYANFYLTALAPDMARELLRLRRELTDLRGLMKTHAWYLGRDGLRTAAEYAYDHALRLTRILDGDAAP